MCLPESIPRRKRNGNSPAGTKQTACGPSAIWFLTVVATTIDYQRSVDDNVQKIQAGLAFVFGVVFLSVILAIAIFIPKPTDFSVPGLPHNAGVGGGWHRCCYSRNLKR